MRQKKKINNLKERFGFCFELLKESKLKVIIFSILLVIAIFTGIIVAIKTHSHFEVGSSYGIVDITTGGLTTTFFARLFSMLLIAIIVFGCSFLPYLLPIAIIFLGYRAYLLGLNITLMIILYGFSGILVCLLIALPCQLIALAILTLFYILMCKTNKDYKCFGIGRTTNQKAKIIFFTLISLLVLCLIESLFLSLFSAKIILVI